MDDHTALRNFPASTSLLRTLDPYAIHTLTFQLRFQETNDLRRQGLARHVTRPNSAGTTASAMINEFQPAMELEALEGDRWIGLFPSEVRLID